MSNEEMGKAAILGQLKDEGYTPVLVNRIEELATAFNDNLPQFCVATRGQLAATYNKLHPGPKGLASGTYKVYDRFVAIWKQSRCEAREVAKEVAKAEEARAAEKEAMRQDILDREVEFSLIVNAMTALETLKLSKCTLGRLLDMYDLARSAQAS